MCKKSLLLFSCTISFLLASAQVSNSSKNVNQIWQNVEALSKAIFETKDGAALQKLVHEKVTYGHSGGAIEDKAMMIKKATESATIYKSLTLERTSLVFIKKTAVVRHTLRATSVEKDISTPLDLAILQTWVKEHGDWKLLARQAVKIAPKK